MPDDFFEDLLREVAIANRLKKRKDEAFKKRDAPKPEALVICQIRITCNCGEVWEVPNSRLLLRFGKVRKKFKVFLADYNNLPRELYLREDTSPGCRKCFETSYWSAEDVGIDR